MSRLVVLLLLVGVLVGCGATPEPTEVPPTQTPWIIVVTATPDLGVVEAQATPTSLSVAPTPTRRLKPTASPTVRATAAEATGEPTATAEQPTPTVPPPTATSTPEAAHLKYAAPELLDPPPDQRVPWKSSVLLKWSSVGELAADEYYALEFYRPPRTADMQPYGDYAFVKETEFLWQGSFLAPFHPPEAQGEAVVYWWVRVVRKTGEDEHGKPLGTDLSLPSPKWTMILDPKPEGQ